MLRTKTHRDSNENRLNSSGQFSHNFRHYLFFARSKKTWRQRTSSQKTSRTGSSSFSMFNDIVWKKNDKNCISNAEEVRNYAMRFLQRHWTFLGPGSEEKWYGDSHDQKGQWNCTASNMVQRFKETSHRIFKSTSALSRGIWMQRRARCTIHTNGDF